MGLIGILFGLCLLIWLSFKGWSVLLLAPLAAMCVVLFSNEPLLAHWTQTFMGSAARFLAKFFPLFLLGALFGKLMENSGSISIVADFLMRKLGANRAVLAVVLAGALVTYGGVSLFVAFFVLAPMAQRLFRLANIPRHLMPAAIVLGTSTFTMSSLPGTPSIQNAIPMPFFGTTPFAAPGLGIIASIIMLAFGLYWLHLKEKNARLAGEGFDDASAVSAPMNPSNDDALRERAVAAREFDPTEILHGKAATAPLPVYLAALPLAMVVIVNLIMSLIVLPNIDVGFLNKARWGGISLSDIAGVWAVMTALLCAIFTVLVINWRRFPNLRETMDAGANASVLPAVNVASLVGFGSVVAAMPAFEIVKNWVLDIGGSPLVSLAVATNLLAALTGSASGGLTIALDALGNTYMMHAAELGINPALLHRIAVIGSGTLDSLPHNGAVVTLLAVCGSTHKESYRDIVMVGIVGALLALIAVIVLGSLFGSF
ncbi:MAG: GntP family permease [Betaproteobacteria bacterium]|nr:GntP family permease [Betaproteobacteria bacterium]